MSVPTDYMQNMLAMGPQGQAGAQAPGMGQPSGYPMAATNPLTQTPNMAQQAGTSALPGGGMSPQQKMMMAQALMQMGKTPQTQPMQLMHGNNTGM